MSLLQGLSLLEATQRAAQHKGMMELAGRENPGKLLEGFTLQGQCWGSWAGGESQKGQVGIELCVMDGVSQPQAARSQGSSDISSCGSPHHGMPQRKRRCQVWPEPAAASNDRTG